MDCTIHSITTSRFGTELRFSPFPSPIAVKAMVIQWQCIDTNRKDIGDPPPVNGIHCDTLQRLESNKHSTLPQTTRCLNQRHQDFMRSVANSLTARHNALSDPATQGQDTENPRFSFTTSQRRRIQRHLPLPRRCADSDNRMRSTTKTTTRIADEHSTNSPL